MFDGQQRPNLLFLVPIQPHALLVRTLDGFKSLAWVPSHLGFVAKCRKRAVAPTAAMVIWPIAVGDVARGWELRQEIGANLPCVLGGAPRNKGIRLIAKHTCVYVCPAMDIYPRKTKQNKTNINHVHRRQTTSPTPSHRSRIVCSLCHSLPPRRPCLHIIRRPPHAGDDSNDRPRHSPQSSPGNSPKTWSIGGRPSFFFVVVAVIVVGLHPLGLEKQAM